jgi:hypothetical protein
MLVSDDRVKAFAAGLELAISIMTKRARHETNKTPGDYASRVKRQLGNGYTIITTGEGPSFLSDAECDAARASIPAGAHERHLVAFMTRIFQDRLMPTLPSDYVLVNSEEYRWLPQRAYLTVNYIAPDHFIAPHYLVEFLPPYKDAPPCDGGLYGTFPVFNARRSLVAIGDAKKSLDNKSEGKFIRYLEALSYVDSNKDGAIIRGFVYDWERCSLMTAFNGFILQITTVQWTTPGSLAVIRNYFMDYERDLHEGLQLACDGLGVSVPRYSSMHSKYGQCVLGAGAYGTVFEVLRGEERLALKLALYDDCTKALATEFIFAQSLNADAKRLVINVVNGSLWEGSLHRQRQNYSIPVAAFLLDTVGIPFSHADDVKDEHGPLILESLSDIHAAGVCHGDARYKNVVRVEYEGLSKRVEFRWIDLRTRGVAAPTAFTDDITSFLDSIGHSYDKNAVSDFADATYHSRWRTVEERYHAASELWNWNYVSRGRTNARPKFVSK